MNMEVCTCTNEGFPITCSLVCIQVVACLLNELRMIMIELNEHFLIEHFYTIFPISADKIFRNVYFHLNKNEGEKEHLGQHASRPRSGDGHVWW